MSGKRFVCFFCGTSGDLPSHLLWLGLRCQVKKISVPLELLYVARLLQVVFGLHMFRRHRRIGPVVVEVLG